MYSNPADPYGQAASNLVAGNSLEQTIQHLMDIGGGSWDRDTVVRALRAAYNNPERAVEYLYSVRKQPVSSVCLILSFTYLPCQLQIFDSHGLWVSFFSSQNVVYLLVLEKDILGILTEEYWGMCRVSRKQLKLLCQQSAHQFRKELDLLLLLRQFLGLAPRQSLLWVVQMQHPLTFSHRYGRHAGEWLHGDSVGM